MVFIIHLHKLIDANSLLRCPFNHVAVMYPFS